jgi:chemotaxis-related protein WspD
MNSPEMSQLDQEHCWSEIGVWSPNKPTCPKLNEVNHCKNCDVYAQYGRQLLHRPITSETQKGWTDSLAKPMATEGLLSDSVLVFRLGDEYFALPTRLFDEVLPMQKVHRIPHRTSHVVRGLVAFRGRLELCVSLGGLLGVEKAVHEDLDILNDLTRINDKRITGNRILVINKDSEARYLFPVSTVIGTFRYQLETLQRVQGEAKGRGGLFAYLIGIFSLSISSRDARQQQVTATCSIGLIDQDLLFEALNRSLSAR